MEGYGEGGAFDEGFEVVSEEDGDRSAVLLVELWKGVFLRRAYFSSFVSFLPRLSFMTSGLNQTCSFRRKNSFPASRTIRGNVTKPTHHHDKTNFRTCHSLRL